MLAFVCQLVLGVEFVLTEFVMWIYVKIQKLQTAWIDAVLLFVLS